MFVLITGSTGFLGKKAKLIFKAIDKLNAKINKKNHYLNWKFV